MSKAHNRHEELLILLHQEMKHGRAQGARADEIGDEMNLLWHQLDDEERDLFDELSEDLYLIEGKRRLTPMGEGETAESVLRQMAQAYKDGRHRITLALARKVVDLSAMLPYVLGRCWERLGFPLGAVCFYDFAYETERKPVYAVSALEALVRAERFADARARVDSIEKRAIVDSTLLLESASILHRVAHFMNEEERAETYGRVVRITDLAWMDQTVLTSLRANALIAAGFASEHLGDHDGALHYFERAATIYPTEAPLLAHGLALLRTDRRQAAARFVDAARQATRFDWPYLYAAHGALEEGRYAEAERYCEIGLSLTDRPELRGRFYEWSAIAASNLGEAVEVVRERFDRAMANLPLDPTIRKNAAAFAEFSRNRTWEVRPSDDAGVPTLLGLESWTVSRPAQVGSLPAAA